MATNGGNERDCPVTVDEFIQRANHAMYALIVPESWEMFAINNLDAILDKARVTGILIHQHRPGLAYHMTRDELADQIAFGGLAPSLDDTRTFGGDVIYCYRSLIQYMHVQFPHTMFEVQYSECFRSIYKEDSPPWKWEEICLRREWITKLAMLYKGNTTEGWWKSL